MEKTTLQKFAWLQLFIIVKLFQSPNNTFSVNFFAEILACS